MVRLILCILLLVSLTGFGDSVTRLVNQHFPPVDEASQRQTAIDSAADALGHLTSPNITVNLGLNDIQQILLNTQMRAQGVSAIAISGHEQLLSMRISFTHSFNEDEAGDDPLIRQLIARLRPEVSGNLQLYSGITATETTAPSTDDTTARRLEMRLLPGLTRLEISNVRLADDSDGTAAVSAIASLLERYRDNITGIMTQLPLTRVFVPSMDHRYLDFSKRFSVTDAQAGQFDVAVTAEPVSVPLRLDRIVWLIDDEHVRALIQLTPPDFTTTAGVSIENTFNKVRYQFNALQQEHFGTNSGAAASWMGIKKELIAISMNAVARQASACVALSGSSLQKTASKISLPDGADLSCDIDRDCESTRECSFDRNHDTRDCSTCTLSRPQICVPKICVPASIFGPGGCTGGGCTGGGCAQMGNDPVCEIAKAAQNQIYLADANLRKADCDRLRAMETAGCQVEVNGQKALCDTTKTVLQGLSNTGNFANLDLEMNAHSDNLKVCMREFNLTPGLEKINLAFDISGEAHADVDIKFVPLDIVGHLTCQFPWQSSKRFDITLGDSRIDLEQALTLITDADKAQLRFRTSATTIKARMSPSPIEYLMTSQEMTLACQGINLLKPVAISLAPFVKELRGEFDYQMEEQEAVMDLPLPDMRIGDVRLQLQAGQTPKALLVSARLLDISNTDSSAATAAQP